MSRRTPASASRACAASSATSAPPALGASGRRAREGRARVGMPSPRMPPAAVTPLRSRLHEDAQPLPRMWCPLSTWGVVRNFHHLLLGPGCLRSRWGGRGAWLQPGHGDGHPLVAMPVTEPSLHPPPCGPNVFSILADHCKTRKSSTVRVNLSEP